MLQDRRQRRASLLEVQLRIATCIFLVACAPPGPVPGATETVMELAEIQEFMDGCDGTPLLVNFWATWCSPCVEEMPTLARVAHDGSNLGVKVITISYDMMVPAANMDLIQEKVIALREDWTFPLPVFYFNGTDYDAINATFGLPGPIPVTLAFDAAGNEVDRIEGKASEEGLNRLLIAARNSRPTR